MVLILNNQEVAQTLTIRDYMQALEEIGREYMDGGATYVPRIDIHVSRSQPDSVYTFGSIQGASNRHKAFVIRMKSDVREWERKGGAARENKYAGRPGLYCGFAILFSAETGEPLAIMNDGYLQHMRAAAAVGLAAKYVARKDSRTLGVLGSGHGARMNVEAICAACPIERIRVFSPTREHCQRYAVEMTQKLGVEVTPMDAPRDALKGADLICLCTDSMVPVFEPDWIEPGVHLNIGMYGQIGFNPLEFFDLAVSFAPVSVPLGHSEPLAEGLIEYAGSPEILAPVPKDRLRRKKDKDQAARKARIVYLVDLMRGEGTGRTRADECTFHGGAVVGGTQGLYFIACVPKIYEEARRRGMGRELPTEWFLQDIRD